MSQDLAALAARTAEAEATLKRLADTVAVAGGSKRACVDSSADSASPELAALGEQNTKLRYRLQILQAALAAETAGAGAGAGAGAAAPAGGTGKGAACVAQLWALEAEDPACARDAARIVKVACQAAIHLAFPALAADIPTEVSRYQGGNKAKKGAGPVAEFQCPAAMKVFAALKGTPDAPRSPRDVAAALVKSMPATAVIDKCEISGPGFLLIFVKKGFVSDYISKVLVHGVLPPNLPKRRVLVDMSSPNIAKEMHVGHLRSTIIGESIARVMEYVGHHVLRLNHVGDWGTQFGMLIAHLKDKFPDYLTASPPIADLQQFYKESKVRFDEDADFKARAYGDVVKLQAHDADVTKAWELICDVSRKEFEKIYERLEITATERGESFYQDKMIGVIEDLSAKSLLSTEANGRKLLFVYPEEEERPPMILVKSDGGFTYDTSDLAALRYRVEVDKADWLIYVVDAGQSLHFELLFDGAIKAGYYSPETTRVDHAKFGVVCGKDGKRLKSRSGDSIKLRDLLDEGVSRAEAALEEKQRIREERNQPAVELSPEESKRVVEAVAYGCIKYADLSHSRINDYIFDFDRMLADKGNTAVYLLYAVARIRAILRTAAEFGTDLGELRKSTRLALALDKEHKLAFQICMFPSVIERFSQDLMPHYITDYMYQLAGVFTEFYDDSRCKVIEKNLEQKVVSVHAERLLLCDATVKAMDQCFTLIGLQTIERM